MGMLAAVETWIKRNHAEEEKMWMSWLEHISKKVTAIDGVSTKITEPHGVDNRSARLSISWDVSIEYYSGKGEHKLLPEKQDGNDIRGIHKSTFSMLDLAGKIDGKKVRLQSYYRENAESISFTFDGVLEGDEFSGVLYLGEYRSANFIAKRAKQRKRRVNNIRVPSLGGKKSDFW